MMLSVTKVTVGLCAPRLFRSGTRRMTLMLPGAVAAAKASYVQMLQFEQKRGMACSILSSARRPCLVLLTGCA
jgi:hypothetical protein